MSFQAGHIDRAKPSWAGDLWGGLAAMLVALPSSIAFGVLTYSALGHEYAGAGAMAGVLGAAALGLVTPFFGKTDGLISAPCAPAAAVLSAFILGLLEGKAGVPLPAASIIPLLSITILMAALLQIFYGAVGLGSLIKFIPFPVVSGYLAGVGVLIALGQLPKLLGLPGGTSLALGMTQPGLWRWEGLIVGLVTIVLMAIAPRFTKKAPPTIIGLAGGILAYFALGIVSPDLLTLKDNALVIGPIMTPQPFLGILASQATSLLNFNFAYFRIIVIPALTLSVLLSVDTLKTCVGLDALTHSRHKSDREIIGQGIGNLVSFLSGGMPGAGTMGPTLVNVTSGCRTFRSGTIEGGLVVLALLFFSPLIAWVPISALAGMLLVIAWRMFDTSMFRMLRHSEGRQDFAVFAGVVIVSVLADLIAAAGVGVVLAILLFIRDQMRGTVILRKLYLNQVSSKTRRLASEREILQRYGDQGVFCVLQGDLFFGTTDQLFALLESDLRAKRFILLDMRRVHSMDYTAAHLFELMQGQLAEHGGQLLFSGMPSGLLAERYFEQYLVQMGVVRQGSGVMISDTLDGALEWMEERILEAAGAPKRSEKLLAVKDFELFRDFDEGTISELTVYMSSLSLAEGEKVFAKGDGGDEIFLVRRGSVRIMLPLRGGKRHHLATIGPGDFFGESSFLEHHPVAAVGEPVAVDRRLRDTIGDLSFLERRGRQAEVEAKVPTDLYVLSRARFDALARTNPQVGVQFFARLAAALAERLRRTDAELQTFEER
jgi:sulfate permease, SulP family